MEPKTIRWLHISDLHMGCQGKEVWWQVRSELKESIRKNLDLPSAKTSGHYAAAGRRDPLQGEREAGGQLPEHFQPIDMILVTGDLTFSAKPEQFDLFDKFLDELLDWLRQAGQEVDPLVITVPGNHDLVHPDELDVAPFYILENFWKDPDHRSLDALRKRLWEIRSASYFGPLFGKALFSKAMHRDRHSVNQ